MRILPYGDRALLVEPDEAGQVLTIRDSLLGVDGVEELVPAARTLLVRFDPARLDPGRFDRPGLDALLADAPQAGATPDAAVETVTLPVQYDGDDLALVATDAGCDMDEVVRRHCAATYTVAFCGFAPGFGYLSGLHVSLRQPRLESPRSRVPAGSVGIAGEFTGVYPRSSPGGWRLLGRTGKTLWDLDRTPPALLVPGTRVRFEPA